MKYKFSIIGSCCIMLLLLGCSALLSEVEKVHSFMIIPPTPARSECIKRAAFARRRRFMGGDNSCLSSLHYPSSPSPSALFLHVESLHPHRDSLVTLTDPILLPPADDDTNDDDNDREGDETTNIINSNHNVNNNDRAEGSSNNSNHEVETHKKPFFADRRHRIAPIALGLYAFGNYLKAHTHNPVIIDSNSLSSSSIDGGVIFGLPNGSSIDVDPIMLGGALIAIGLVTVTWTMDEIVHVVQQYMKDKNNVEESERDE